MRNDGIITIGTELDTKSFDAQIEDVKRQLEEIDTILSDTEGMDADEIVKYNAEAEKLRNKLKDLVDKKKELDNPKSQLIEWSENFGDSLSKSIKKIGKLVLGIFSIRGAYMMVRNAMNTITENDAQLKADIDYMKSVLAYALEPVVRTIVNLAKQLLTLIGGIIYLVTGINIFENANKNLKGANKQAKALKKQLAGFDEMNVLSDTSGGGAGGGDMPSFEFNIDDAVAKVEELKNKWFEFGNGMRTTIEDMPFSVWTDAFGKWDLAVYGVTETIYGLWEMVTGFFEFFKGIVEIIYGLITGDTEMVNKGISDLIDGIWKGIEGLYYFFKGITDAVAGVIKGVIATIGEWLSGLVNKGIEKFNSFKDKVVGVWTFIRDKIKDFITGIQNWLTEKFGVVGTTIGNVIGKSISGIVNAILGFAEKSINGFLGTINGAIGVINKIPGVNIKKLTTVSFPRLAKGGIVNMPGRGVPIGGAIAGERGAEGVIPLTDSQQMALLGEAIGKYININATVPVYVGNRQIAREIKKIEAENDFAYNG